MFNIMASVYGYVGIVPFISVYNSVNSADSEGRGINRGKEEQGACVRTCTHKSCVFNLVYVALNVFVLLLSSLQSYGRFMSDFMSEFNKPGN